MPPNKYPLLLSGLLPVIEGTLKYRGRVVSEVSISNFLVDIFGEKGKHTRATIGVSVLPLNAPVEIEFIFEVGD